MADPSQIQNRSGDRKAAVEMAFDASPGDRAEVKRLFRQLQRIRAVKAEPTEPERVVKLCRQAAQMLEPGKARTQAARTREAPGDHNDPAEARSRRRGQGYSHGMGF